MSTLGGPLDLALGLSLVTLGSLAYAYSFESIASAVGLDQGRAGAVVSPLLTSLPELAVLLAAVVGVGGEQGLEVGEGTVIGEPLVISTLSTPFVLLASGWLRVERSVARYYMAFLALFPFVLAPPALSNHPLARTAVAVTLLAFYVAFSASGHGEEAIPAPRTRARPATLVLAASIASFTFGSRELVEGVLWASGPLGLPPFSVASLLVPSVTALPETGAAAVWARRGLGTMAASALVGEQVLYATVYPAVALLVAPWPFTSASITAVIVTEAAMAITAIGVWRGKLGRAQAAWGLVLVIIYASSLALAR
ncbi:MAG: sodium:calcium antiporter [Acidilobus sp.]